METNDQMRPAVGEVRIPPLRYIWLYCPLILRILDNISQLRVTFSPQFHSMRCIFGIDPQQGGFTVPHIFGEVFATPTHQPPFVHVKAIPTFHSGFIPW